MSAGVGEASFFLAELRRRRRERGGREGEMREGRWSE